LTSPALIDRTTELTELQVQWNAVEGGAARLVVVYGRRQVGKTFLLSHFLERVRATGVTSVFASGFGSASERQQLAGLAESLRRDLPEAAGLVPVSFSAWADALQWLVALARTRPVLAVLDEVPWLVESTPTLPSLLQQAWDRIRMDGRPPRLLLVLCGSAVATMRRLLGGTGALYGRADRELQILPFDLPTAASVLSRSEPEQVIEAYAACGGYPLHLAAWDEDASTEDNLLRLAATSGSLLLRSGQRLLTDIPHEGGYRRVLHAIGSGADVRAAIGRLADQRTERPLDLLLRTTLVRHRRPLGAPDRTPGRYEIADAYLRFWYDQLWADEELIEGGQGKQILARRRGRWERHLGWVFEEQAREHAVRLAQSGTLPSSAVYGPWWATRGPQAEIDVLGLVGRRTVMVGEAKWDRRPLHSREFAYLMERAKHAPDPVSDLVVAFWSRGGLSSQMHGALGFTPADMVRK